MRALRLTAVLLVTVALPGAATSRADEGPAASQAEFFENEVRPLLVTHCAKCHTGKKAEGGLSLATRASLLAGGDSGPAAVAGTPDKSLLVKAVKYGDDPKMPPDGRLADREIAVLTRWTELGLPWPEGSPAIAERAQKAHQPLTDEQRNFWSFQPVREQPLPAVADAAWPASPVDRFILAGLEKQGLRPNPPADKRTLIRRATFDLTGLPPAPAEVSAFVADDSPGAFATVVERLLASPRYGECWGRHWMDVVRYADTAGDNADYPVPEARLYRDYIIDSFNADKPYNEFVSEQLAGDVLADSGPREKYAEHVTATTFLALSRRYLTSPYDHWHLTLEDTIETTGRAFLGLTLRCARCHDHKFDPVRTDDYYALYGIFASTQFPYAGSEEFSSMVKAREHFVPLLPPDEAGPRLKAYAEKIHALEASLELAHKDDPLMKESAGLTARIEEASKQLAEVQAQGKADEILKGRVRDLEIERHRLTKKIFDKPQYEDLKALVMPGVPPDLPCAYGVSEGRPVDVPIQRSGNPEDEGPVVPRGVPKILSGGEPFKIAAGSSGRLELARWLTRPEHPLTARVMVNRIWQHHFDRGIVGTPSNFGLRGEPPTHPELLDWLATRFVESGWSVKAMHRLIVLSKTYQQASAFDESSARKDPGDKFYWRYPRRRLEAEWLRDAMLSVGGRLDTTRPGPHEFPPVVKWNWTQHNPFKAAYATDHRSVYLMTQRIMRHPYLGLFDQPDTNYTTALRTSSTVPLQALYMMNDPFVRQQSQALAERLRKAAADAGARVDLACELAWGRPASTAEREQGAAYVERYFQELQRMGIASDQAELEAWTSYARVILTANEFLYLD